MKKFSFVILTVLLAACSALGPAVQPSAPPTQIPPTAQVIIATVLVPQVQTVVVTQLVQATAAPTDIVSTLSVPATLGAGGPLTVNDNMGGGFFTDITYSKDKMSLRCAIKTVTFTVKSPITQIVNVDFWYRIEDKIDGEISEWKLAGPMTVDSLGSFSITFSAESIHPDLRRAQAWLDFQFVGLNTKNLSVGNSEKLVQLINYSNDCQ